MTVSILVVTRTLVLWVVVSSPASLAVTVTVAVPAANAATDDLHLNGDWSSELGGHHTIRVRKPGFLTDIVHVDVGAAECHVVPRTVQARLAPDTRALPQHSVSFIEGPEIDAWPLGSVGVQAYGDTLEIKGFAPNTCEAELRVVSYDDIAP